MPTRPARPFVSRARPCASASTPARAEAFVRAAALAFLGLGACALNTRPGDGLETDGLSTTHQFGTATQQGSSMRGGPSDAGVMRDCKNLPLFVQHAIPRLIADCSECHDGTKLKAVLGFDLIDAKSTDQAKLEYTCDVMLTNNVKYEERLQSPLFTEVDPARIDLEHEFKYDDPALFAQFRDAVMLWLQTE
jgi:hypothetical protein